jgi:hypothetical protein
VRVTGVRIVETTTVGTDVVVVRNRVAVATLLPQEAIVFVWLNREEEESGDRFDLVLWV